LPLGNGRLKVAVANKFEFMTSVQVPAPEQAPDHPEKLDPGPGEAISRTIVPLVYLGPDGLAATVPLPVPAYAMVKVNCGGMEMRLNLAVTNRFELMVTLQAPVPEHAPDHPAKVDPELGEAVSETICPRG